MSSDGPVSQWRSLRFIVDESRSGAMNMARDEALALLSPCAGQPCLRVYRFDPPAVSIGRFQDYPGQIDTEYCLKRNIEICRRPTGGLAILHLDDFTYSFAAPTDVNRPFFKEQCFKTVAEGILGSLRKLGIEACIVGRSRNRKSGYTWCFDSAFGVDLDWSGKKICGSAQKMFRGAVLQHGTLFLRSRDTIMKEITVAGELDYRGGSLVDLSEAGGRTITWNEVLEAFRTGFPDALELDMESKGFNPEEEELAGRLFREKYMTVEWLESGS